MRVKPAPQHALEQILGHVLNGALAQGYAYGLTAYLYPLALEPTGKDRRSPVVRTIPNAHIVDCMSSTASKAVSAGNPNPCVPHACLSVRAPRLLRRFSGLFP
jgi:hypothetical protein